MLGDSDYGWGQFNKGARQGGGGAARLEGDGQLGIPGTLRLRLYHLYSYYVAT